jgi:hypothetical protein
VVVADVGKPGRRLSGRNGRSRRGHPGGHARRAILGLIVVVPQTQPRVSAPLGWVLSQASRDALNAALRHDATSACEPGTTAQAYCPAGVAGLRYLLRLIPQ